MRRYCFFLGVLAVVVLTLVPLLTGLAAPLQQTYSLTIVSNQGQAIDQQTDRALLQVAFAPPPDPQWDNAYFDDSGWANAFPVIRQVPWNSNITVDPIVQAGADHVWGGAPSGGLVSDAGNNFATYANRFNGTDYNNGHAISGLTPQTLFLRKTFCVALDADVSTISSPAPGLELMLATDFGANAGAAFFNQWPVNTTIPGDGVVYAYDLSAAPYQRGQNTLALWAQDNRGDDAAAVLYRFGVNYAIDPNALTVAGPTQAHVAQPLTFNANHDGLSGPTRSFTFRWNMGDGSVIDTGAAATVNYAYPTVGTFTGVLTVTENGLLGCNAVQPFTITIRAAALNLTKVDRFDPVAAGDFIFYDLTVQNTGPIATLGDTVVTDTVPADTVYVSCSGGVTCGAAGGVVSWNVGPLAPGASAALSFGVRVNDAPPPDPPLITNASYGAGSGGGVSFSGSDVVTTTIIVLGTPTPTPTATPTSTTTPTPTATATPTSPPPATATSPPGPPPPTSGPAATNTPTATNGAPTPAFLPPAGQGSGGTGAGGWMWGGLLTMGWIVFWAWRRRRAV